MPRLTRMLEFLQAVADTMPPRPGDIGRINAEVRRIVREILRPERAAQRLAYALTRAARERQRRKRDQRRYRQKHKARLNEYRREYWRQRPEKQAARVHAWIRRNPERYRSLTRAAANRRRAALSVRCGCCTDADFVAFYHRCPRGHQVDHVLALALGGAHCIANLQYLTVAQHREKTRRDRALIRAARKARDAWLDE